MTLSAPDLTQRAPRSPRVRLGGYVTLPRMLDKCRATLARKNGEFHYNCPLDQNFLNFAGINAEALKKEVAKGKGDGDILAWIEAHAKHKHTPQEIAAWSAFFEARAPSSIGMRAHLQEMQSAVAPLREDVTTIFDLLDVDDFVTFGGQA